MSLSENKELYCLTGSLMDKEIVALYGLKIPTIRYWKNKSIDDVDSWKRVTYELLIRYVAEKDEFSKNIQNRSNRNSKLDIQKNLTLYEIGEKDYGSFRTSPKEYKIFISNLIEFTPPEIFAKRVIFLKECIDSVDNKVMKSIYNKDNGLI